MRKLTQQEIRTLIAKEIDNMIMHKGSYGDNGMHLNYMKTSAENILKYIDEYFPIEE